eukprot:Skav207789  [mRNA]  locus=scaffold70:223420:225395:- [translate_table: standard]
MSQAVLLYRVLDIECSAKPTLVLYTSAICKARKNWRLALELFQEIGQSLLEANDFSYGATISACEKAAQWLHATWLLYQRAPDLPSFNATCSACRGAWQQAWQLLQSPWLRLRRNVISFNSTISTCEKSSEWCKAWSLHALMLLEHSARQSLSSDVISFDACISACGKAEQPWQLSIALAVLASRLEASLVTYNATLTACKVTSGWLQSLAQFSNILRSRTSPDVVTHNAAITACRQWQWAFYMFHQLEDQPAADIITYGAVIKASENVALWQSALTWLGKARVHSLRPDVIACNSSISACEKAAQWLLSCCLLTSASTAGRW